MRVSNVINSFMVVFFILSNPYDSLNHFFLMPAGAVWTSAEETAFVDYLVDHKAEAGDGGNFKTTTYQRVISHIAPLHESGAIKTVKACRNKWTAVSI